MNVFLKKNCKFSVQLLEYMQETNIPTDDVKILIHGNDPFPSMITRTPTILYNNFPYTGKKAFELIRSIAEQMQQTSQVDLQQQEPARIAVQATSATRDLSTSSTNMVSQSLDGFGALYDDGNHVMLSENGFQEQQVDLSSLKEDEPQKDLDLQALIDARNADIARLAPPQP